MDLLKAITKEHSKAQCDKVVRYVGSDRGRFAELMQLFLQGGYRVTQRAAWPVSYCVHNYPELIKPYYAQILPLLKKPGVHDAVVRNIVRLLQFVDIPKRYHGQVMDTCFAFVAGNEAAPAVKAFSLTVLENLSKIYPDIKGELQLIIEERWAHESPAFKSRAKKVLVQLNKQ
jgi:hypothetical protein